MGAAKATLDTITRSDRITVQATIQVKELVASPVDEFDDEELLRLADAVEDAEYVPAEVSSVSKVFKVIFIVCLFVKGILSSNLQQLPYSLQESKYPLQKTMAPVPHPPQYGGMHTNDLSDEQEIEFSDSPDDLFDTDEQPDEVYVLETFQQFVGCRILNTEIGSKTIAR